MKFPAWKFLLFHNSFCRAGPDASAAANTFFGIDPAASVFLGNGVGRAFTVAGTAVHTSVQDFVGHSIPLLL